ncbi:hypothetical protein F4778DRAFT_714887 [Xylariomycetidae sp. FL2044]|nr:hypothetical protein F4778DRAFT_714887 [Xylariomycetidae sp. FL2044]
MADNSAATQDPSSSTSVIVPTTRNFRASVRLHLQHMLFQKTLGHLLEQHVFESVADSKPLVKVADIGCGNAVWLCDLESELLGRNISCQLDGYDNDTANFPAAAFLPHSVTLKELDILAQPLPEDARGVYDVVHIRTFASSFPHGDVAPILSKVVALLKPGGWLQWEESRVDLFTVQSPTPEISKMACTTIDQMIKAGGAATGLVFDYLGRLDQLVKQHGFDNVQLEEISKRSQDLKAWTEDYLMVWEGLALRFPPKAQAPQAPMTRESYIDLFSKAVQETEAGVVVHQQKIVTVIGQKPM